MSWKPYRCSFCGWQTTFTTNHTGPCGWYCEGCSWKGVWWQNQWHSPGWRKFTHISELEQLGQVMEESNER